MKHLIFMLSLSLLAASFLPLAAQAQDREDAFEYDLYDRMRSNQEFSDYDYPQRSSSDQYRWCPTCPQNRGNYDYQDYQDRRNYYPDRY